MQRYVAFLRGMNLGGRRITNDDLGKKFEQLGMEGVACFRASGNVIFASDEKNEAKLGGQLESGLSESLGCEVPVFLRSSTELQAIAAHQPFDAAILASSKGKLQVVLLLTGPPAAARKQALSLATEEDRLAIEGRELYWLPRGGMSESELDLKTIGATLGLTTIRTKGTIDQIAAKHFGG